MFILYAFSSDRTILNPTGNVIECEHLPRVGEVINIDEEWIPEEQRGSFVVFEVDHSLTEGEMITSVSAICADESSRLPILRAGRWLPEKQ